MFSLIYSLFNYRLNYGEFSFFSFIVLFPCFLSLLFVCECLCVISYNNLFLAERVYNFVARAAFFSLPAACRLFSRGVIFTRARVSLALLSLRKNGGLLVVYALHEGLALCYTAIECYWLSVFGHYTLQLQTVQQENFNGVT